MQIQVNKNNTIIGYAVVGEFVDGIDVTEEYIEKIKAFDEDKFKFLKYQGKDKEPLFDEKTYQMEQGEKQIDILRQQRETECFSIINRGQLWYDTLTAQQTQELNTWYKAWLDVTETKVIPVNPNWI